MWMDWIIMDDKEIGNWVALMQPGQKMVQYHPFIMPFIRKLVEERKRYLGTINELNTYRHEEVWLNKDFTSEALKQFGIDLEIWNKPFNSQGSK